ncbi:hypothetical protein RZS08_04865, partial [Arthrospira platensis SPKY1]|nr:hypothetical protein [Arthrospira platensis SPKY1]
LNETSVIYASRYHDLFCGETSVAITMLQKLAAYRCSISVLTKAAPDASTIDALVAIDRQLRQYRSRLIVEVSCTSGKDHDELEPGIPPIADRLAFMRNMLEN